MPSDETDILFKNKFLLQKSKSIDSGLKSQTNASSDSDNDTSMNSCYSVLTIENIREHDVNKDILRQNKLGDLPVETNTVSVYSNFIFDLKKRYICFMIAYFGTIICLFGFYLAVFLKNKPIN